MQLHGGLRKVDSLFGVVAKANLESVTTLQMYLEYPIPLCKLFQWKLEEDSEVKILYILNQSQLCWQKKVVIL